MKGINAGNKNGTWLGNKAKITSIHSWVRDNFTKPDKCEICGKNYEEKSFDWSNKNHKYSRIRDEWQYVCRKCHINYDIKHNNLSMNRTPPREYEWSLKYPCCIHCGRNNVKYKSKGMCSNCYRKKYEFK
jgi:hypothetical protein